MSRIWQIRNRLLIYRVSFLFDKLGGSAKKRGRPWGTKKKKSKQRHPLSSSILIDYPLFLLNRCWDSRFARKGEKNARETMAIVSRAVTTSPFTPRFGKPTLSQGVVTLRGQQTEWLQGLADPAGSIGCFSSHDKESIP